jgi:hypothetical protein
VVTTTAFEALTREAAHSLGFPGARVAVIDHPLGGIDDDAVRARADAVVERLVALLTG